MRYRRIEFTENRLLHVVIKMNSRKKPVLSNSQSSQSARCNDFLQFTRIYDNFPNKSLSRRMTPMVEKV